MGKRKDAVNIDSDIKPYAGGAPHCFPQVCLKLLFFHELSVK
jgi:hypothetical protein